jgi:hypothetical protein
MTIKRVLGLGAAAILALAGTASAQLPDVMICDSINEKIFRLADLDGDGFYASTNEGTLFVDTGAAGGINPYTAEMRVEAGMPTIYWVLDSMPDGLFRAQDTNGDGAISLAEQSVFYDAAGTIGTIDPLGIALTPDGAVWFGSDFEANTGLWRCFDGNGDGDAMDPGETVHMVDGSSPFTVLTDIGPRPVNMDDVWHITPAGNGVVLFDGFSGTNPADELSMFRFQDVNTDGDVTDPGEARLFLNYTGKNPTLPQNPDFASGLLRSFEIPNPMDPTNPFYGRLLHVAMRVEGPQQVFYFGCDSSNTSQFALNINGQGMNGLIYRARDLNGDFDANDAGEVNLFYDGSATGPLPGNAQFAKIVGMKAIGDWVYVASVSNGDRISRLRDMNGDGDAMDAGEAELGLWDKANYNPVPPFPSLGPFVDDIALIDGGLWAPSSNNFVISGTGCSSFGTVPTIAGSGTANIGTSNFSCIVGNTGPSLPAICYFGTSTTHYLGAPILPLDLSPLGPNFTGCIVYHNLVGLIVTVTNPAGQAAVPIPFPNDPSLAGRFFPLQWLVIGGGIALSPLGEVLAEL